MRKKIGIVVAQIEELLPLYPELALVEEELKDKCTIVKKVSGVGMLNASLATQSLICNEGVDIILNLGVSAGRGELQRGDIINVNKVYNGDFDISIFDHSKFYMPGAGDYIQGKEMYLPSLPCFSISHFLEGNINTHEPSYVVDMEYYGIAYTCQQLGVPCYSIKCITDTANNDEEAVVEYNELLHTCCRNLADILTNCIPLLLVL